MEYVKKELGEQNCIITLTDSANANSQGLERKLFVQTSKEDNAILAQKSINEVISYVKDNCEQDINTEGIYNNIESMMGKDYIININGNKFSPNSNYMNNKPASKVLLNDEDFFDQEIDQNTNEPYLTCDISIGNPSGKTTLG